ncbi:hypothetical protein [Owenweeksia hongkongensis]|uniref:hypothetical protein n=1 Tax=Owenweeksia hongkongensis TaxID=253245 RepID=UPI003A92B2AC
MNIQKKLVPHIIAIVALIIINAIYFYPAFTGKTLEQDDIKLGVAKSKEIRDYRDATGEEPLWTNSMFSGMPTFLLNIHHNGNIFEHLEPVIKLWQPAQIGVILFLMLGFYFLLSSYNINPWVSVIGAVAFAFSAFFIISFDAGHNAKIRAAGYIAPMLMGILLTFRKKYLLGLAFTALFAGLAVSASHIQITYYSVIIAVIIAIVELISAIKTSTINDYLKSIGVLAIAAVLAIGPNVSKLWTTYEYSKETIRGGGSGLKAENEGNNGGLDKDYAMSWSYGITETLNLLVPDIMGGGSTQNYEGTQTHDQLFRNIKSNLAQQGYPAKTAEDQANRQIASLFYWGDQSMVNGGYYLGASIFFLFVLGCFLIRDKRRTWIVASIVIAVFMSWGSNLSFFNDILFEYLPLYNKFRVPSMTLTIVFVLMPLMGMFALDYVIRNYKDQKDFIQKSLLTSFYISGGLFLVIALIGPALFEFSGPNDARLGQNPQLVDLLIEDRKALARSSAFRSFAFAGLMFGAIFLFIRGSIKQVMLLGAISLIVVADLWSFDKQHLNSDDFVTERTYNASFNESTADKSILKDQGYYRVFNLQNPFNDALTSYYHHSIGGYHGAKMQRYQELYENVLFNEQNAIIQHLQKSQGQNIEQAFSQTPVLNMLNGKYIIYNEQAPAIQNPNADGSAWFVQTVEKKTSAKEVIESLKTINTAKTAVVNKDFADYVSKTNFSGQGIITLASHKPREMVYETSSDGAQFAVFSEIYYRGKEKDWQAYIDNEPVDHIRVNYVLRGMNIPAGKHTVRFEFKPKAYFAGETISMISSIILGLVFIAALVLYFRKNKADA